MTAECREELQWWLTGVEWEDHGHSHTRLSDNNRFITKRVGGNIQRRDNAGTLVPSRASRTHKCHRIKGCNVCSDGLCQGSVESTHTSQGGQSSHHGSDKQNGGSKVPSSVYNHKGVLGVLPISAIIAEHVSGVLNQIADKESRCFMDKSCWMLNKDSFSQIEMILGKHGSGSVCRQINLPEKVLCQLETRSRSYSNRRIYTFMVVPKRVGLPSVLSDKPVSGQSKEGQGDTGVNSPSMASTAMVPNNSGDGSDYPNSSTSVKQSTTVPKRGTTSTDTIRQPEISGVENIRDRLRSIGFSEDSSELFLEARRSGTRTAFQGPWKKWCSWCVEGQIDTLQASVGNIANFLTSCLNRGLEYATLNTYRSTISAYHPMVDCHNVGQHPFIVRLMKGAFNKKPPKPRYTETWDVNLVLEKIVSLGPNDGLDQKMLTLKLAMLMALTTVFRTSELHKVNPALISDKGDHVICHIADLTKTKRQNKPYLSLKLFSFLENELLDVVSCLRTYLAVTQPLRLTDTHQQQLFLSIVTPHNPVKSCVTFGVYIGFGGLIDGCSALGVVYEVSLEVVMTTHA